MMLSLHRCKICGTRWLLWPDAVHGGGWNLLDMYQRPGSCCDNVAMGDQIEHLRDLPLSGSVGGLQEKRESVAWLVALGSSPPQWWTGRGHEFTSDVDGTRLNPANCAIRFARKEDADRAIGWLIKEGTRDGCKSEEHIWL